MTAKKESSRIHPKSERASDGALHSVRYEEGKGGAGNAGNIAPGSPAERPDVG